MKVIKPYPLLRFFNIHNSRVYSRHVRGTFEMLSTLQIEAMSVYCNGCPCDSVGFHGPVIVGFLAASAA